jgi:hypothetical protein
MLEKCKRALEKNLNEKKCVEVPALFGEAEAEAEAERERERESESGEIERESEET